MSYSPSSALTQFPLALRDISKQVEFYIEQPFLWPHSRLVYHRGRVTIAGIHGVYVLTLGSVLDQLGDIALPPTNVSLQSLSGSEEHNSPFPKLRVYKIQFGEIFSTEFFQTLELSETKLYLSVHPKDHWAQLGENMWCYDFASSPLLA